MVLLPTINTFLAQENFLTKLKYYDYENCGKSRQTKQKYYILKGNTIKIEDAPWTVAIAEKQGLCTGTLISKKHVLTAFHCFKSQNIKTIRKTMKFVMNGTCLPLNAEDKDCKINEHYIFRKAARVMFSENYNEEKSDNDYAIVELDEEVPFNEHACLPFLHNQPTENYESLKAIGYGAVLLDDGTIGMNGKLQEYIYPMEPSAISNCSARVNTNNTYNMFRVFVPGTGGICFGDSGLFRLSQ
uniref:Peptidase S1 domain-containing protein n=1 Tax=Rhabditophanes sp. KR3021 TaxID=114890 RepID=A0AC35U5X8_9BILA